MGIMLATELLAKTKSTSSYTSPSHQSHMYHYQPQTYQHYQQPAYHYPTQHSYSHSYYPYQQHQEQHHDYGHHPPPSYHKEEDKGGLSTVASLLVPLLGLIGLSLLVPNVVGLRAKREVPEDIKEKQAQALLTIYNTVLTSEDCVKKLLCEMGQLAKNAKDKDGLFKLIDRMVPTQFQQEVTVLKEASMTPTYTCKKYNCQVTPPVKTDGLQDKT